MQHESVKLVARTLDLFEVFAMEKRPLSLTELARRLSAPMSSTLALARTLVSRGYLFEDRRSGGYYPTSRLSQLAVEISAPDPAVALLHDRLCSLRDNSGETVVLGKLEGTDAVYLDVIESYHPIRYVTKAGDRRPLYANSIGKTVFATLSTAEQESLAAGLAFQKLTAATLASVPALLAEARQIRARGWAVNLGESAPDLAAVAIALDVNGVTRGVSIGGPRERIEQKIPQLAKMLLALTVDYTASQDEIVLPPNDVTAKERDHAS